MSQQVLNEDNLTEQVLKPQMSLMKASSSLSDTPKSEQISISFAGCGFNSFYYVGVTACLKEYSQINEDIVFCGASSGIMPGLVLLLDLPLDESLTQLLDLIKKIRSKPLGILQPSCDLHKMIYDSMNQILPEDSHTKVSGRLYISATRVSDGMNALISQFDSKEELIRAIQCSSFMPFISGLSPPKYRGVAYLDGALSNNAPKLNDNTITVSPWSGEFDICPMEDSSFPLHMMWYNKLISISPSNLYRMSQIAFPPDWEAKSALCQEGFNDTLRFLLRSNKIFCTRCMSVPFPHTSPEDLDEDVNSDSGYENTASNDERQSHHSAINCTDCQNRREVAVNDSIPEAVVQAVEEASHQFHKSVLNRLSQHTPIKLLIILLIPFLLLFELIIALISGIFMNDWSSDVFKVILNMTQIMINNGLMGREVKSIRI